MTELVTPEIIEAARDAYHKALMAEPYATPQLIATLEAAAPLIAEEVKERCAKFVEAHTMGRSGEVTTAIYRSAQREALAAAIRNLNVTEGE